MPYDDKILNGELMIILKIYFYNLVLCFFNLYSKYIFYKFAKRENKRSEGLIKKNYNIIYYFHIAKTGGQYTWSILDHINSIQNKFKFIYLPHKVNIKYVDLTKCDFVLFNFRDPIERFISAFNYRRIKFLYGESAKINLFEQLAFKIVNSPNNLAENLISNNFIKRKYSLFSLKNIQHLSRQSEMLNLNKIKSYQDKIYPINIKKIEHQLTYFLNEILKIDFDKKIFVEKNKNDFFYARDNSKKKKIGSEILNDFFLSEKSKENLKQLYNDDYLIIKYLDELVR